MVVKVRVSTAPWCWMNLMRKRARMARMKRSVVKLSAAEVMVLVPNKSSLILGLVSRADV